MRGLDPLVGHFWTVWPHLRDRVAPPQSPAWSVPWQLEVPDDRFGSVRITGVLCDLPAADTLVVIIHGLGGSADSPYCVRMASIAAAMGLASLRLNLRGADRSGEDIYHAGLTADLRAAVESEPARRFRNVVVVGFSLGGHIALRFAAEDPARAEAVAAVCSPLDLAASCAHIDGPGPAVIYRQHLLRGLREMYRAALPSREMPPVGAIRSVQSIRDWDERVVAPRFGFAGARDYWARASVAPLLGDLGVRCLYLGSRWDPMVADWTVLPALEADHPRLEVRWLEDGGHVGFPGQLGVERQVLGWLIRNSTRD